MCFSHSLRSFPNANRKHREPGWNRFAFASGLGSPGSDSEFPVDVFFFMDQNDKQGTLPCGKLT